MEKRKYKITEALDMSFVGIEFEVLEGQNPEDVAISVMDSNGYDEWCDENDHISYDFDFEEMDDYEEGEG